MHSQYSHPSIKLINYTYAYIIGSIELSEHFDSLFDFSLLEYILIFHEIESSIWRMKFFSKFCLLLFYLPGCRLIKEHIIKSYYNLWVWKNNNNFGLLKNISYFNNNLYAPSQFSIIFFFSKNMNLCERHPLLKIYRCGFHQSNIIKFS